ncbi:MAG: D-alanyl-D-alanine carboxypeptidase family protein, partial [Clostridia bacterium]
MKRSSILLCLLALIVTINVFVPKNMPVQALGSSARGMCVIEASTGRVLYEQNKDRQLAMASTTKVVTALTVLNNCQDLEEEIVVSEKSVGIGGTSIYLRKGERLKVKDLLYGLMLRSGNDAATALAIHVGGSVEKFAEMMEDTAKQCGAKHSSFANPHGLDEKEHYTTAYDLALISAKALENPIFREIVSTKNYQILATEKSEIRYLHNKNKLLSKLDGCIGVKTGFTDDAGRCLVSATERNGMRVVCVVLNCGPMFEESTALLNQAHEDYTMYKAVEANTHLANKAFYDDKNNLLYVYCKENIAYPIKAGEDKLFEINYKYHEKVKSSDNEVGTLEVYFKKHLIKTAKLYTI